MAVLTDAPEHHAHHQARRPSTLSSAGGMTTTSSHATRAQVINSACLNGRNASSIHHHYHHYYYSWTPMRSPAFFANTPHNGSNSPSLATSPPTSPVTSLLRRKVLLKPSLIMTLLIILAIASQVRFALVVPFVSVEHLLSNEHHVILGEFIASAAALQQKQLLQHQQQQQLQQQVLQPKPLSPAAIAPLTQVTATAAAAAAISNTRRQVTAVQPNAKAQSPLPVASSSESSQTSRLLSLLTSLVRYYGVADDTPYDAYANIPEEGLQIALQHQQAVWDKLGGNETGKSPIPRRLLFTHHYHLLESKEPARLFENVERTIQIYREAWGDLSAPVDFYTNPECRDVIRMVKPELIPHFDNETIGAHKGDICRVAALYLTGGYYFDVDMKAVQALDLTNSQVGFVSVHMPKRDGFFQSFIAATPAHPVLHAALDKMLEYYTKESAAAAQKPAAPSSDSVVPKDPLMGTLTLQQAYYALTERQRGPTLMLEEANLGDDPSKGIYPNMTRQEGVGACNHVVHNAELKQVYFYSRIVGFGKNCMEIDSPEAIAFLNLQAASRAAKLAEQEEHLRSKERAKQAKYDAQRNANQRAKSRAKRLRRQVKLDQVQQMRLQSWTKSFFVASPLRRYSNWYEGWIAQSIRRVRRITGLARQQQEQLEQQQLQERQEQQTQQDPVDSEQVPVQPQQQEENAVPQPL